VLLTQSKALIDFKPVSVVFTVTLAIYFEATFYRFVFHPLPHRRAVLELDHALVDALHSGWLFITVIKTSVKAIDKASDTTDWITPLFDPFNLSRCIK
jgi:hypothetical protein